MNSFEQRPVQAAPVAPVEPTPQPSPFAEAQTSEPAITLPTMGDLDRLAADLDRVDMTLVEIDGPAQPSS